jgi:anti-sigma regulatory factor (Ser/Thr protein kinase)
MTDRFELEGQWTSDQVADVRRFVERLHRGKLADEDLAARVATATHELFDNAVKFSTNGEALLRIDLTRDRDLRIKITTRNRANATHIDGLRELARELREAPDVMAFYVALMRRARQGGLGIGRIAAETEMAIDLDLVDDMVVISAELAVGTRA